MSRDEGWSRWKFPTRRPHKARTPHARRRGKVGCAEQLESSVHTTLGRTQALSRAESCLPFEVILQPFIYSLLSQRFLLISQDLLESTDKQERCQGQEQKYEGGLVLCHAAPENQDWKDQTEVKYDANSNLLLWIFWITSCYQKPGTGVAKELPKWCHARSWEVKKKSLNGLKMSNRALPLPSPHTSEEQ